MVLQWVWGVKQAGQACRRKVIMSYLRKVEMSVNMRLTQKRERRYAESYDNRAGILFEDRWAAFES
jgi:hypothetical protein